MTTELDLIGQESDPLAALVLGWLATKRSVNTRRAYGRDLAGWLGWLAERNVNPLEATETDVAMWARHLEAGNPAASTVARKLSAVSGWYSWLARNQHVTANPVAMLARPVVDPDASSTPGLTRDQALALLKAADTAHGPQQARTSALVSMLLLTGARVSEALGADIEDLGTDRGHRVIRVKRKGGKLQSLVMPAPAAERMDAYLVSRSDVEHLPALPGQPGAARPGRPLFVTASGARMLPDDVRKLLQGLGRKAGLPADLISHLGPHAMRHSFATLALDSGASLRHLQDSMGHADPRTTRRYDRARNNVDQSPGLDLARYLADD